MASSAAGPRVRWSRIAIAGAFVAVLVLAKPSTYRAIGEPAAFAPENTLAGFRTAIAIGVTTL
jgi:hypothetical protein